MTKPMFTLISYTLLGQTYHDLHLNCEAEMRIRKIKADRRMELLTSETFQTIEAAKAKQALLRKV